MATITELKSVPMLVVASVSLFASWLAVSLRVYVRGYMIRSFGWDDWLMIVSQALFTMNCACIMAIAVIELTAGVMSEAGARIPLYILCTFGLYILCTVVFKISLAIFFLRVVNQRWQRQVIYASVTIYSIVGIVWLCVAIFQCGSPVDFAEKQVKRQCLSFPTVLAPFNYVHGALNAVTDWIFAIIPIFVVRATQMTRKAKLSVIGILALGAAGSIASVVRLGYVHVLGVKIEQIYIEGPEYAMVSIIELGFGITAASLATLRPLFSKFLDKASNAMTSQRSKRSKKTGDVESKDHGIMMERSVNVGYSHELEPLPKTKKYQDMVDSGIASPVGKDFSVSVKCLPSSPRVTSSVMTGNRSQDLRQNRSKSQASSERSLLYIDRR